VGGEISRGWIIIGRSTAHLGNAGIALACDASAGYALTKRNMDAESITRLYRDEYGRILAALIRTLGDFELAQDALQEAFAAALEQWPTRIGSRQSVRRG